MIYLIVYTYIVYLRKIVVESPFFGLEDSVAFFDHPFPGSPSYTICSAFPQVPARCQTFPFGQAPLACGATAVGFSRKRYHVSTEIRFGQYETAIYIVLARDKVQ
jgi:hypothetical protein